MKMSTCIVALLCASPADARVPIHGKGKCDAARVQMFVGALATADVGTTLLRRSRAKVIRWLPPGTMAAMNYRTDRLDLRLDGRNYIVSVACG